ncbi:MAG TPA: hypothetical protein VD731_02775 [Nitrosopumilaceae archaeon]|nr:hypothetical protein [Nitrosopumilaceae archaeon]
MFSNKIVIISVLILIIFGCTSLIPLAQAVSVSIDTEKETFFFGDYLTFTVKVDEIIDDYAILFLIDENGKKSSPIPFPITQLITVEKSPFPFEKAIYPEGKWTLEIEYLGAKAQTVFFLRDSGQIVIPMWIKDVGKMWSKDLISSEQYTTAIEYLIKENIIVIPETQSQDSSDKKIPQWIKTTTSWWSDGMISDQEYAKSLEYLIKIGIIIV